MSTRGLARVAALYGQVERVRLGEWRQAAAAVDEAEQMRAAATEAGARCRMEARASLAQGEMTGWRVAESAAEVSGLIAERAKGMRQKRDAMQTAANLVYVASRMQTERITRVVEGLAMAEMAMEQKREQATADDRFAARLCWSRMKGS